MNPIITKSFDPSVIIRESPPKLRSHNLEIVYRIADAENVAFSNRITYSRWGEMPLPTRAPESNSIALTGSPNFFVYDEQESSDTNLFVWHLNFANFDLFSAYGSGLFAQDEMQAAEHPVLASLRETLLKQNLSTLTIEKGRPTPILIRGVERRIHIATEPNAAEERPNGLYGNQFARAKVQAVRRAITKLSPSTITNIIAIEAPPGGTGFYNRRDIEEILCIAYTGFRAAKLESNEVSPGCRVVIHTGFWGCGAYGGNRTLMAMLQMYAARLASIDQLVFHAGDQKGLSQFHSAGRNIEQLTRQVETTGGIIEHLASQNYPWGVGDGN